MASEQLKHHRSEGSYVDIYLLPVPQDNIERYRRQASAFAQVTREHGAISYREFLADGSGENLEAGDGQALTAAVVEFESRAHRDEVMDRVLGDPRVQELMRAEQPADMTQMRFAGFQLLVAA